MTCKISLKSGQTPKSESVLLPVQVVGEDLVIRGKKVEKKDDPEGPEGTPLMSERHGMMAFERTFPLFDDIKVGLLPCRAAD